jgi:hypothetical protein
MATLTQETKHAINHFFRRWLITRIAHIYMPLGDFFRGLWWRAWGHNPNEEIEFHMSQIVLDDHFVKTVQYCSLISRLAEVFFGLDKGQESRTWWLFARYANGRYLRYDDYITFDTLFNSNKPGKIILEVFHKYDNINDLNFELRRAVSKSFNDLYNEIMLYEFEPKDHLRKQ